MDLDALFGAGAELGESVVIKAQLRFRVHPPRHPAAQDIVDRLVAGYDERLGMICREIDEVLAHPDVGRPNVRLVVALGPTDVVKAARRVKDPYAPGARGG